MSWLESTIDESEAASQIQRLTFTDELPKPGFWKGSIDTIGPGLKRGAYEGAAAIESGFTSLFESGLDLAAGALLPEPRGGGTPDVTSAERSSQQTLGKGMADVEHELRPDPASVGVAGQIINEVSAIIPRTIAGTVVAGPVGGAVAAGAPAGYAGKQSGMYNDGLDESTATLKGVIEGTTTGVGALLPAAKFVKPLLGDATIAVGANVGLGVAQRGATAELLEGGGYHAQAAQYRAMDGTALATDAILGAAFFGIGRAGMRRPTTEHIDAALTERTIQHADIDTAPGAPINPRSAVAHQDALRTAIDQIQRGEPVVLPESIHSAQFLRTVEESPVVAPPRDVALATARQDLEPRLRLELEQEAAGILPNVKDVKAELSAVSRSLEGLDETFRARAKEFQQQGQSRKRAEQSARRAIEAERLELSDQQASLNDALGGNRTAEQARADLNALGRGEVPQRFQDRIDQRADTIAKGFEKNALSAGVAEANTTLTMAQIARQEITRILDDIERAEPTLQAKPLDIGQPRAATKSAPDATKQGKDATQPAKTVTSDPENATSAPNDATRPAGDSADADPVVQVADEILTRVDDMRLPTGAMDADGNPVTVSAKQLLAEADADIQQAQVESEGFAAAAACSLQRGE